MVSRCAPSVQLGARYPRAIHGHRCTHRELLLSAVHTIRRARPAGHLGAVEAKLWTSDVEFTFRNTLLAQELHRREDPAMTVSELIELLAAQPSDYLVAVRTVDHDNFSIWDDAITGLAEIELPDDESPGYVILNYEGNETGELSSDNGEIESDDDEDIVTAEDNRETHQSSDPSLIQGPDGREWTWQQIESWVISLSIRNALEMFHGGGAMDPENPSSREGFITDRQMKALNIVVRRTVSKMIENLSNPDQDGKEIYWTLAYINRYMEPPGSDELESAYEKIRDGQFDPVGFIPDCTRSEP
jgi:hypothetical protein